jgi:hypothetical protein
VRARAATVCKIPLSNAPRLQAILFIQPVDVQFLLAIDLLDRNAHLGHDRRLCQEPLSCQVKQQPSALCAVLLTRILPIV